MACDHGAQEEEEEKEEEEEEKEENVIIRRRRRRNTHCGLWTHDSDLYERGPSGRCWCVTTGLHHVGCFGAVGASVKSLNTLSPAFA